MINKIKLSITDLTSAIDKDFKEYRFCDWVTGKPEKISCYTITEWHKKRKDKMGMGALKFRNAKEVRRFARWLLANAKDKDKQEL